MTGESQSPNLADLLLRHPFADDEAVLFGSNRSWTLTEARDAVAQRGANLLHAGLQPGDGVGVVADGASMVLEMTAVWSVGGVLVPINPRLPQSAIDDVVAATQPAWLVNDGDVAATGMSRRFDAATAFVLWTSGTTGRPKPVLHTHHAYLELIDRVLGPLRAGSTGTANSTEPAKRPTPNLIPVSMSLNAGIYNALFGLRAGSALVVLDRFEPTSFAAAVRSHHIRSTVLPPAAIAMLNDSDVTDLTPLRFVRSITAPLSVFQARRFAERFGAVVLNGYGQAEIGEVVGWTAAMARDFPDKLGSIGRPHPGVDLLIDDPDDNGVGELLVRPPNRATGYADGTDLAGRITAAGFVRTGDLARIDAEEFVWIEGRLGDVINRGGNKIFPEEVEEVIAAIPGIAEVAVVGVPDQRLGEVPVAAVVLADEHPWRQTEDIAVQLDAACRTHLVPYKVPQRFVVVDSLARTEIGKIRRADVAARLTGGGPPS